MKTRLTDMTVKQRPPDEGYLELWDDLTPGFGLRISPRGKRTFNIQTRVAGKQFRRSIGTFPAITLKEARAEAKRLLDEAAQGIDTVAMENARQTEAERQADEAQRETERAKKNTVRAVSEEFMADYGEKLVTGHEYQRKFDEEVLPHWGHRPIDSITRREVRELIRAKARKSPTASNRLKSQISKFFNWCVDEEILDTSPATRIKGEPEHERERVLTDDEIAAVWHGADELGGPLGRIVQMMLLTAQRKEQTTEMEWTEIVGNVWMVPGEKMKMKEGLAVPLSEMALEVLARCDRYNTTDLVFTSNGETPYSNWSNGKKHLDRILEQQGTPVKNWQFRDLRRSAATGMRSLGVDRLVVSKILAHKEGGVTKIYDRYALDPEKRAALVRWAQHVQSLVSGEPAPENVVPLLPLRATTD